MKIINIENFNTFKELFEDNDIDYIIINIGASWCKPCNNIRNDLNEFIEKIEKKNTLFFKIDYDLIEEDDSFSDYFDVKKIPYFYIFKDKNLLKEFQTSDMEIIQNNINTELFEKNENNFNLSSDF